MSNEWCEDVEKVLTMKEPSPDLIASAITGWLRTEIAQYTEGRHEAVSRRAVWLFPDGCGLTVGAGYKPVFFHMSEELSKEAVFPMPDYFNTKPWVFAPHVNGWFHNDSTVDVPDGKFLADLLEVLTVKHGEPELCLPWSWSWYDNILDNVDDYVEWGMEPDEGDFNVREFMIKLVLMIKDGSFQKKSSWVINIGDETDWLSDYSDFIRFSKMLGKIEDESLMILDLDQHCAGCSAGTREWAEKDNPKLKGKDIFRTWGQNSEGSWFGDGTIRVEATWFEDAATEKKIKFIAEELGLYTGIYEDDWKACGDFEYWSPEVTLV